MNIYNHNHTVININLSNGAKIQKTRAVIVEHETNMQTKWLECHKMGYFIEIEGCTLENGASIQNIRTNILTNRASI